MRGREKTVVEGGKVAFEAVVGRWNGEGIFAIEDEADKIARQVKLRHVEERIAAYDHGYERGQWRCPRCGQVQLYKGDASRELVFDCATLTVQRASYIYSTCHETSYPLDDRRVRL